MAKKYNKTILKMNYAKTIRGHMKLTYNGEAYRSIGYKNLKLQTKNFLLYIIG